MVLKVEEVGGVKSDLWSCTVLATESKPTVYRLSEQQNCYGQFRQGQRVAIRKDPLGLTKPYLPDDSTDDDMRVGLYVSVGLFLATALSMLYGGLRRRADRLSAD